MLREFVLLAIRSSVAYRLSAGSSGRGNPPPATTPPGTVDSVPRPAHA